MLFRCSMGNCSKISAAGAARPTGGARAQAARLLRVTAMVGKFDVLTSELQRMGESPLEKSIAQRRPPLNLAR